MNEAYFVVGSLKFTQFKELWENIKGRSQGFSRGCDVVVDSKSVLSLKLTYQMRPKHQFILEWDPKNAGTLNGIPGTEDVRRELPRFIRTSGTNAKPSSCYGYIPIRSLQ